MTVKINSQWAQSERCWTSQDRADAFIDRMNRGGLPAKRINLRSSTTYIEDAVFVSHQPEADDVTEAIVTALLATR